MKKQNFAFDYGLSSIIYGNQAYNNHLANLQKIYTSSKPHKGAVSRMQSFSPTQIAKIESKKKVAAQLYRQSQLRSGLLTRKKGRSGQEEPEPARSTEESERATHAIRRPACEQRLRRQGADELQTAQSQRGILVHAQEVRRHKRRQHAAVDPHKCAVDSPHPARAAST